MLVVACAADVVVVAVPAGAVEVCPAAVDLLPSIALETKNSGFI